MAQGPKAPPSFSDALGDIHMAIAQAKVAPDADLGFLNQLEMVVMGRLKHPDQQQQPGGAQPTGPAGGGAPGPPASGGAPADGPPPPGAAPSPPQGPPQGGPDPHAAIPKMDPDEMRRVIAESTGQ
jgi:hypothetical protein